ncbi:TraR/DksA family transcriptional regulator [Polymorphum gilvum]|uniref:Transcriptional regulator, TraR/DksA family protein n=1 Tax=Polymorphum gilvum (strain LMG 25793 / CGMCC 1.9160 / SL003B-26A1) TaxID=991905 RepID=F2J1P4_POLGS|nr:TraR/DksA C4-type zinc finger protein [Polymorphum gilvum]ADZ70845.1 Transcriptional regulator, TraR/DksA family protein [Polymorphum gilvum SL003B-26A1]
MTVDLDLARTRLAARKAELEALSALSAANRAPVELDQQAVGRLSRMDALQMQAMAQAAERQRRAERARLDSALRRLTDGDYGYCLECGEEIPDRRLAIDPAAALCVRCAT